MRVKLFVSPDMGENCYFVIDEETKDTIIIDPGAMADKLCSTVDKNEFVVRAVCLTHAHFDHAGAAEKIKEHTKAPILLCEGEEIVANSPSYNLSAMWASPFTVPYDRVLSDGEKLNFGSLEFKVISTPGHTPGGCCYYFEREGVLFSGDTLFNMSVGRTDFPGGDSDALLESIRNKLFVLPADTEVFTGHGPQTTIGYEMENNSFLN